MKRIIAYLTLAVLLVSACTKREVETVTALQEMRFMASVGVYQTKATDTAFDEEDRIGLTISDPVGISNLMLKPEGQYLSPESPLYWPVDMEQDQAVCFMAYYPYELTATSGAFDVTQKWVSGIAQAQYKDKVYTKQDYMSAVTDAAPADGTIELQFHHLMSRFNITIVDQLSTESFSDVQTDDFRSVEIGNLYTWFEVDFVQQSAMAKPEGGQSYPLYPEQTGSRSYSLILPPQTVLPDIAIHLASGKTMNYEAGAPISFPSGKQVSATLILTEDALNFTYEITDWVDDPIVVDLAKYSDTPPDNEVWYYTIDGDMMKSTSYGEIFYWDVDYIASWFDTEIESHTYENGMGVIRFKSALTGVGTNPVYAFQNVDNLRAVAFPNSVKTIGSGSFMICPNLKTVRFPSHLEKLGDGLFANCVALTELNVPDFDEIYHPYNSSLQPLFLCRNLRSLAGPYASEDGRSLIKDGVLVGFAPAELTSYAIPEGVTEIREYTFSESSLQNVTLPGTLKAIGRMCFNYSSLMQINLPESLEQIGDGAFSSTRLSEVHIPASVQLGNNVFGSCSNLREFSGKYASKDGRYLSADQVIFAFAPYGIKYYAVPEGTVEIACDIPFKRVCLPSSLERITASSSFISSWGTTAVVSMAEIPPVWEFTYYSLDEGISIFVPAASVEAYKTAKGWSVYANYIKSQPVASEPVDLGLPSGLKWASCNLGASRPEEEGMYFCWGDVFPQAVYWSNGDYCYMDEYGNVTKYNGDEDAWTNLEVEDDAAIRWLGGSWRMPTYDEWCELIDGTTQTYTSENDVPGYRFDGTNGNSIFLPASVTKNLSIYWSSTLYRPGQAIVTYWNNGGEMNISYTAPYYTAYVRPVLSAQ